MSDRENNDDLTDGELDELEKFKTPFSLTQSNELFDDDAAVRHKLISVRRISLPKKGENWEISEDGHRVMILRGVRLTNKEKEVLRTVEGIRLVMEEYKSGSRSVSKIKAALKEHWKNNND